MNERVYREPPRSRARAVMVVRDAALRDEVRRVAAALDCELDEIGEPIPRSGWQRYRAVILDASAAHRAAADELPRRGGVAVVTTGPPGMADWRAAALVGAAGAIALPDGEAELAKVFTARDEAGGGGAIVAVVGGRGGAGASTLAAALARVAAEDRERTLLVDGDGFGGGIDLLLGIEDMPGLRWPALVLEGGRIAVGALHAALPSAGSGLAVLACGRGVHAQSPSPGAVAAVLESARAAGDLVVADVPRRDGEVAEAMVSVADLAVVVVPAELRASAAAEAVARYVRGLCANAGLVVRGPTPGGLHGSDVAAALALPLLAAVRAEPGLSDRLERGGLQLRRRSPLRIAAAAVLAALADARALSGRAA